LVQQRLLSQLQSDQIDVLRLQQQVSTGRRIQLLSEDAPAGIRGVALQRLLEQKEQVRNNVQMNQSFLSATDTTLSDVSGLLSQARAQSLGVTGASATEVERAAVVQEIDAAIAKLLGTGNANFRGRYLFAGSLTAELPFEQKGNYIRYNGNENRLESYADVDLLFETNATGSEVFGAISDPVVGTADFNPILTANTKLSDLNNGSGVSVGSIQISDGTNSSIIDLSVAHTVGDVVAMIEENPPTGRTVTVEITPTGLSISLDTAGGGDLRITEVGGGTSARDLGILAETFVGTGPMVGTDVNPRLQLTTPLNEALGAQAYALIDSTGTNNSLRIEANDRGGAFNGYTINITAGPPGVTVAPLVGTTFNVQIGPGTTATQLMNALNAEPTFSADFTASLDTTIDADNDGSGAVAVTSVTTAHGSGVEFDQTSGLQILNGDQVHVIDLSTAVTVEDLLNTLNDSQADVLAELNDDGRTISIRSRLSGSDFAIGENGGNTATHLGLRTFIGSTRLEDLNHGLGIHANETGDDFIIRRKDGVELRFDMQPDPPGVAPTTIGDVIDLINNHLNNAAAATRVVARLAVDGNGIELVDDGLTGNGQLTVLKVNNSQAAEDLGLIPVGQASATTSGPASFATANLSPAGGNNDLIFTANQSGPQRNGVQIVFTSFPFGIDDATVNFNAGTNTLTINYDPALTTANTIVARVTTEGTFAAALNTATEPGSTGTGLIGGPPVPGPLTAAGGTSQIVTGRDTNPQEVDSIFNSLIRLRNALVDNDEVQTGRALTLVEAGIVDVNFVRADIGARQQGLDVLTVRLEDESINLEAALSDEIEVDLAEAISNLVARQATLQASLQMTAQLSRLTLLDFL
jgi:flagellin-like hook-associated protein FlgL